MQQDPLSQRVDVEERRTDATASALLSRAEQELLDWFNATNDSIDARIESLDRQKIRLLLDNVRQLVSRQEAKFACMLEIGSALGSSFHVDDLLKIIVEKTTELMDAERSTIFLLDDETGELWSKIIQGTINIEIRLRPGQGVAGWVASTGKSLNIRDAYGDQRFNPSVDESTGYQTRNILCQPIRNLQGEIIGVIQVLNRVSGNFTDNDEYLLSAIASQAAIAIENSKLYLSAVAQNMELIEIKDKLEHKVAELDMLYELERQISQAADINELIEGVFRKTTELVHAQMACLRLKGDRMDDLYTLQNVGEWEDEWRFDHVRLSGASWQPLHEAREQARVWCRQDDCSPETEANPLAALPRADDAVSLTSSPAFESGVRMREERFQCEIDNLVAVPLWDEEDVWGSFELFNTSEVDESGVMCFSEDARKIVSLVAAQLAASLTARRRREEEEKNSRLASIGQMLSGVLHDLKNPMAIISGYVQLMARADDPEQRKQYAGSVLKQFDQLNQMTRELLMFARGDQHILLRKVYMHKFMEEVRELLEPELQGRHVELSMEIDYKNDLRLDSVKMKRAILNLGRNAAEAMGPDGGHFLVRVGFVPADPETGREDQVRIDLCDDGPGIPVEIRDRLFESFVTQGKKDGTGLGLAIVKKIVEDHGGQITFDTATGEGTTFHITLPLNEGGDGEASG